MDRLIVALDCEGSGFILLSATESPNALTGWIMNGPVVSLLSVSEDYIDGTNYFATLGAILKEKGFYCARLASCKKTVVICKKKDDIIIKVLELNVVEIAISLSDNSTLDTTNLACGIESHLLAAQSQLASQGAELAALRQRCEQLLAKYTAVVDETAQQRDSMLGAFCQILNAKKARIRELLDNGGGGGGGSGGGDSEGEAAGAEKPKTPPAKATTTRGKKRQSPAPPPPQAPASTSKPQVRRTRSNTKKPRSSGSADDDA